MNKSIYQLIVSMSKYCTIPNMLTFVRLLLTPFIINYLFQAMWLHAFGLFIIAGMTDFLDGYIARLTLTQTDLGRVCDPLADKILIIGVIGALAFGAYDLLKEQAWLFWFLISKELLIIAGGIMLFLQGKLSKIRPHISGKIAMSTQLLVILLLFLVIMLDQVSIRLLNFFSVVIVAVNIIALFFYIKSFRKNFACK